MAAPQTEGKWLTQIGRTGTETQLGLVISQEYNRELHDLDKRVKKYREMRSDPAVDTALKAGEKSVLGAQWQIHTEADGGQDGEIRDFLEDNLYPVLDQLLEWLLGSWQFGWATVEPVFGFREGAPLVFVARGRTRRVRRGQAGKVWIKRLVHLLPESVEGFRPDRETGELLEVEQAVYVEGEGFLRPRTPGWKVLHAVHGKEGDDFSGRSMLRAMFMPWDVKLQLLRSFAVHWDRFGTGTPHMQAGADWNQEDRELAEKYLRAYRSGTEGFLITPHGGELTIFAGEEVTKSGPMEMIRYLDGAIAKVALTQITELGTTATGHRALGESFLEILETALQGQAEAFASLVQSRLIVPLVDMNFGERDEYPQLLPAVQLGKVAELVETLAKAKGGGLVGWTAEDEARLRDMAEMPEIDVEVRQAEMDEARAIEQEAMQDVGEEPEEGEDRDPQQRRRGQRGRRASRRLAHAPDFQREEDRPTPALAMLEREVVLPRMLADRLDSHLFRLGNEVDEVLDAVNAEMAGQAVALAEEGAAAAARGVARLQVPRTLRTRFRKVLMDAARRAIEAGRRSVEDEDRRQSELGLSFDREEFVGPADAAAFGVVASGRGGPDPTFLLQNEGEERFLTVVDGQVDRVVQLELSRRENAARDALLRAIQQVGADVALVASVRAAVMREMEALSPAVTRENLNAVVNVAFGTGRQATAEELIDRGEIAFGVRSEVLDSNTCGPCALGDGTTFTPTELRTILAPPFPDCRGRHRCRGIIVYVRRTERPSNF